jgi:hypothetical protein
MRNANQDFEHPGVPPGHPLCLHCLYRVTRSQWSENAPKSTVAVSPTSAFFVIGPWFYAALAPSHLLFLHHTLAHHLIYRGLREGR